MFTKTGSLCLVLALLASCAYHEGQQFDINNPVVRKVGWFSYLDGNDVRETCASGGSERYRLVYNGQYDQQLRSYEVYVGKDGGGIMNVRARNNDGANLSNWTTNDPFSPWNWQERQVKLTPAEVQQFRTLLAASGYGQPAPAGLQLSSQDFYWVAAGCDNDVFHFYAWNNRPQSMAPAGFTPIKFQDFLLKHDQTGIAFRPAHVTTPLERRPTGRWDGERAGQTIFTLTVGKDGINGLLNAF